MMVFLIPNKSTDGKLVVWSPVVWGPRIGVPRTSNNPDIYYKGILGVPNHRAPNHQLTITLPETNVALKIDPWKRRFLLETTIFSGYVVFRGVVNSPIKNTFKTIFTQFEGVHSS